MKTNCVIEPVNERILSAQVHFFSENEGLFYTIEGKRNVFIESREDIKGHANIPLFSAFKSRSNLSFYLGMLNE